MKSDKNETEAIEKFLLRINKDVKDKAEARAKQTDRSLNGHILFLIKEDINQNLPHS